MVWGLRKQVSLLLANGHIHARDYPIGLVKQEVAFVIERENAVAALNAVLTQQAIRTCLAAFSGAEAITEAHKAFVKVIADLRGE